MQKKKIHLKNDILCLNTGTCKYDSTDHCNGCRYAIAWKDIEENYDLYYIGSDREDSEVECELMKK